jgi:hypothetical protein
MARVFAERRARQEPDLLPSVLATTAAQYGAELPALTTHRRCVDVDLGSLEAPDRFAYAFERIVAPAIQAMLDTARADRLTLLRLKVRRPDERHDGLWEAHMRLDFDCGEAGPASQKVRGCILLDR